ncbi:cytochrome c2 [Roseovarius halotolerans]|uniref:Cytochrome c-552 n=1 Tax=Roseovarius halotolerans TaxID=505353 RepID=A0A1X6ZQ52_9RHOB|nr:cytochrome c family protein [Roseovarius halotolerans]RKT28024.1 cytochrome c2 [Roseovarius halotolerans]SLN58343.1 Cytochrome c-552 [Roseovarius halotolerans]
MFDTMTFTKVVGALCGTLLIFLLGGWASELIYHTGGGHGEDHQAGYVIETGGDEGDAAEAEEGPSFAERYASADPGKGERVFNKCKACHKLEEGVNSTGPYLYGVVGRTVDTAEGYGYSGALEQVVEVWTPENLYHFLENPQGFAPGTTMSFAGLGKSEDRVNVIAYLDMSDGDMTEVAAAEGASTEEAAAEAPAEGEATAEAAATEEAPAEAEAAPEANAEAAPEAEAAPAEAEAATETEAAAAGGDGSDFAAMVAAANPEDGEGVWRFCRACHKLEEGKNGVGPHLYGVVGREIGSVDGFRYSKPMQELGGTWTVDELNAWLENPKEYLPGNKMAYGGLKKEEDRAALIAYIQAASE